MQKYISLRIHTALYLSIFLLALHHVFVYFANSSILKFFFKMNTSGVLVVYGVASVIGIIVFIYLSKVKVVSTKRQVGIATVAEMACLCLMYLTTTTTIFSQSILLPLYISMFCIHHLLTPYLLFNLDLLFESYTRVEDRGHGRGIYLTMWNMPFVIVPILLSVLSMGSLPLVYIISTTILIPFIFIVFSYLQNPNMENFPTSKVSISLTTKTESISFVRKLKAFWNDRLDRNSFLTQSTLHLYYGITGVMLPIYLYTVFGFGWGKIGIMLAVMMTPFILTQIPFGNIEDKQHNEKFLFLIGLFTAIVCTVLAIFVDPTSAPETSFFLLMFFLFFSRIGCSLIEISTESMFYKHVTERDSFALMMFRSGRFIPYTLGLIALFWL